MPKFGHVNVPGGTDPPNFGPIPLKTLEKKFLAGDIEAVRALDAETLERVIERTRQQAVALIILDVREDELIRRLMEKYHQGHHGDKWLQELREKGMRKLIRKLRKVAKF